MNTKIAHQLRAGDSGDRAAVMNVLSLFSGNRPESAAENNPGDRQQTCWSHNRLR
jgi:hypothetical protein